MKKLLEEMNHNMLLADFSLSTRKSYSMSVIHLQDYYNRPADQLSEDQIKSYLLYLKEDKKLAPNTLKLRYQGIQFLFTNVLARELDFFKFLKVKQSRKLPVVLSEEEVKSIINALNHPAYKMIAKVTYLCGLRINEALNLHASNINRERMTIEVRNAKGAKDRYLPMSEKLLQDLEYYWVHDRRKAPGLYLFPKAIAQYDEEPGCPMKPSSVRRALKKACKELNIIKNVTQKSVHRS